MLNNLNYYYPDFPRNRPMIPKDKLPKRPFIFNDHNIIANNQVSGNKEVEEFKKILAQSSSKKTEETNIATNYTKSELPKEKLNIPFASFWGIEDGWL